MINLDVHIGGLAAAHQWQRTCLFLYVGSRKLQVNMTKQISSDSTAILMLCTHLGLSTDPGPAPLTLRQWNPLARKLVAASLSPGDLLGSSSNEIAEILNLEAGYADRLARLLERGGVIAIELERLESRGIWVWTRADTDYPKKYRQRLKESAPSVLFGAGDKDLPGQPGLAVVGSRDVDDAGKHVAEFVGNACDHHGLIVYSGGARGVDLITMRSALEGRGYSVGILPHNLESAIRKQDYRRALREGNLTLLTPYSPSAGFSAGGAMGRNKLIYTLADYALVVASAANKGGTWGGSTEALKKRWLPVFVVDGPNVPEGNRLLLEKGALPFPMPFPADISEFRVWLEEQRKGFQPPADQHKLM